MNLMQKMAKVMEAVQYLQKDDRVDAGMGKSYRAITEEKVTTTVRAAMLDNGIIMYPIKMDTHVTNETVETKNGPRINRLTHIDVVYRMVNVDDPADSIEIASSGSGVDTQDKGIGKAMTYAYKYALLRTFAIPTGEDPDAVSSARYTDDLYEGSTRGNEKLRAADSTRDILIAMGGGDTARVAAYAEKCYPGVAFEDMTLQQLNNVKVKLSACLAQQQTK